MCFEAHSHDAHDDNLVLLVAPIQKFYYYAT